MKAFKIIGPAVVAFTWRHRDEVLDWAGFALRAAVAAVPGGETLDDVKIEARLRFALARDRRIRNADGLRVDVRDGVARIWGVVTPEVQYIARALADSVEGVVEVEDRMKVTISRFSRAR
ncbi:MAG: BON domain-containing protein [Actinomycetota bacterium]|nr:BON domain-containing protein [Actinomycetota bacterium]